MGIASNVAIDNPQAYIVVVFLRPDDLDGLGDGQSGLVYICQI